MTATKPVSTSPLDAYWGSDGSVHVNFFGTDGHVHELCIVPGSAGWVDHDLTALTGAVAPIGDSPLAGYWGSDNSQHVNFIGTDGHVHELYLAPGAAAWVDNDLTVLAGAALPNGDSALVGYWGSDRSVHVNFVAGDEHVHELYIAPGSGWVDNDLTNLAGGVASGINRLDGYWGSNNSVHVNFIAAGVDHYVHELYIAPGAAGWVDNNLTALAGAVAAAAETPLDGYWGSNNSQHVNFIGADNNVHELYIAPGATGWVGQRPDKVGERRRAQGGARGASAGRLLGQRQQPTRQLHRHRRPRARALHRPRCRRLGGQRPDKVGKRRLANDFLAAGRLLGQRQQPARQLHRHRRPCARALHRPRCRRLGGQ